jgi:hypothetical protein
MGRQVGFYAVDADFSSFLRSAQDLGLVAVPELIKTGSSPKTVLPTELETSSGQFFYLLPQIFSPVEVFYNELPDNSGFSKAIPRTSPIIECGPCPQEGDKLFDSRLFFEIDSKDRRYKPVREKYDSLAQAIRGWEKTNRFNFYVAPKTAELARSGQIRLRHHQVELNVL